ncbi:MAG: hypothetical protein CMJ83_02635 [Planctomycetes bacterium]|nr:hypothetical protein [Planctomycetota bacterium]
MIKLPLVVALGLVVLVGCANHPDSVESADVAVVATFEELLEQTPIDLGDGVRVRLGIQARSARVGEGVLLYCIADGMKARVGAESPGERLGPLQVVRVGRDVRDLSRRLLMRSSADHTGSWFFVHPVVMREAGPVEIALRMGEQSIATVIVEERAAQDSAVHAWLPFQRSDVVRHLAKAGEDPVPTPVRVTTTGPVVPHWKLFGAPLPRDARRRRLPTFLPDASRPDLRLVSGKAGLTLTAPRDVIVARPDWHLVARWWIDGVPVKARPVEAWADMNGIEIHGRRIDVCLDGLDVLGARPEQRVEVQLMYLLGGWTFVGDELERAFAMDDGDDPIRARTPMVSNRVTVFAPR